MNHNRKHLQCNPIESLESRQLLSAAQFHPPVDYSTGAQWLAGVAIGDFNHDGKQDVACIGGGSKSLLEWFAGDGKGGLGAAHVVNTGFEYQAITVGDYN